MPRGFGHIARSMSSTLTKVIPAKPEDPEDNFHMNGYAIMKKLGEGSYGQVRMIQEKKTKSFYALKYIDKRHKPNILRSIIEERNNLSKVRHPFICNLKYAFQTKHFYCLVLDLASAADLRTQICKFKSFDEVHVKLWIAELACAIEYLHSHNIVHRDVKPENILVSAEGHVKLADFNIAREITKDRPVLYGLSGTFHYMAPEMHRQIPYTELVDWWALGIVFYECIYGKVPFKVDKDRDEILRIMLNPGLQFPEKTPTVTNDCVFVIQCLLQLSPHVRVRDTTTLFNSNFFFDLDRKTIEMSAERPNVFGIEPGKFTNVFKDLAKENPEIYCKKELKMEFPIWLKKKESNTIKKGKLEMCYLKYLKLTILTTFQI